MFVEQMKREKVSANPDTSVNVVKNDSEKQNDKRINDLEICGNAASPRMTGKRTDPLPVSR